MKKILLVIAILAVVGFLFFLFRGGGNENVAINKNADIIYFHGKGCPHCEIVEEFMKKNNVEAKIKMEKAEIFFNKENAKIFKEKAIACGITDEKEMGVPLLWVKGKCYTGDKEITSYFEEQLK